MMSDVVARIVGALLLLGWLRFMVVTGRMRRWFSNEWAALPRSRSWTPVIGHIIELYVALTILYVGLVQLGTGRWASDARTLDRGLAAAKHHRGRIATVHLTEGNLVMSALAYRQPEQAAELAELGQRVAAELERAGFLERMQPLERKEGRAQP